MPELRANESGHESEHNNIRRYFFLFRISNSGVQNYFQNYIDNFSLMPDIVPETHHNYIVIMETFFDIRIFIYSRAIRDGI